MMDITDKVFHVQVLAMHVKDFEELGKDVDVEFLILDGPFAGHCLQARLDNSAKTSYLEQQG